VIDTDEGVDQRGHLPAAQTLGPDVATVVGVKHRPAPARQYQIRQPEQGEQPRKILGQFTVACLAMAKEVLDPMEGVLLFGSNARLGPLDLLQNVAQPCVQQRPAFAWLHRHVPSNVLAFILGTLLHALVARIQEHVLLVAMQQRVRLGNAPDVCRRSHDRVPQSRFGGDTDVRLHPEVSLLALLRLMYFRVYCLKPKTTPAVCANHFSVSLSRRLT